MSTLEEMAEMVRNMDTVRRERDEYRAALERIISSAESRGDARAIARIALSRAKSLVPVPPRFPYITLGALLLLLAGCGRCETQFLLDRAGRLECLRAEQAERECQEDGGVRTTRRLWVRCMNGQKYPLDY